MIPLLMVVCLLTLRAPAQYSGGTGEPNDPYQIATATDLIALGEARGADYEKHFILTADIDLDPNLPGRRVFDRAVIAPHGSAWFAGVFDGRGHMVSNLTIEGGNLLGLFGQLSHPATICNLDIKAAEVKGTNQIGTLVGYNSGWIVDCHSTAAVNGIWAVGGLAGYNGGRVMTSSSAGTTNGDDVVGGLIGNNGRPGVVTHCYNAGTVSGTDTVGGLIGEHSGSLARCSNTGVVGGTRHWVGGVVGYSLEGDIASCHNTGAVSGEWDVGGLVGKNGSWGGGESSILDCYNTGVVSGEGCIGGLVGYNNSDDVTRCYNVGAVIGRDQVGGLVGGIGDGAVRRCLSVTDVRGEAEVGGLVGFSLGLIDNCYAIAAVTGERDVGGLLGRNGRSGGSSGNVSKCFSASRVSGTQNIGGLVGSNELGTITASFWDVERSGLPGEPAEGAKTTAQMQQASTFLEVGWDFVDETENGARDTWGIDEGRDYPRLQWYSGRTPYSGGGTGAPNDPYRIATGEDLILLGQTPGDYHRHFILTADIDLDPNLPGRRVFHSAVIAPEPDLPFAMNIGFQGYPFTGVFDGNGHKISHMTIDDASYRGYLGLFGQLGLGAEVSDLGLEARVINAAGDYVGGLAGENHGCVATSCSTGTIGGSGWHFGGYFGGLIGSNRGYVTASYSTSALSEGRGRGGVAAENWGRITTCYSAGTLDGWGWQDTGGLVGSGSAASIISSLWDVQTSGEATSKGGTGKTTAEMQTASTFLGAGWDFVGETDNGTDDIWWIDEGQDYPRLWWETAPK